MAQQNRSIGGILSAFHILFIVLWTVVTACICSVGSLVFSPFSLHAARMSERLWYRFLLVVSGVRVTTEGLDRINKNQRYIFLSNHQSYFDIPVLSRGLNRELSFVAKKELFSIPVFGWAMSAVGHIKIDRKNARKARLSIIRAVETLRKKNISLVLFPEGTRSPTGELHEFKRASFTVALEAGVPIVPVVISGSWKINRKKSMRINPGTVKLTIADPIPVDVAQSMDKGSLMEKVRGVIATTLDGNKRFNE